SVQLDQQYGVARSLTSKEMTMNVDDFERLVINPAVNAIAENINSAILDLYVDVPYYTGTSGTTPDALSDLANVGKVLNQNDAPSMDRALVMDFEALAAYQALDSIVEVDKSGTNAALRQGLLGQIYGMTLAGDGQVNTHTAGTFTAVATPLTAGSTAAGATEIDMDGGSGTETILKGDIFTIDGQQYVATANATASGGAVTVPVYPAVPAIIADNTAVAFPDTTADAHVANLGFHRDAFALAMAPLEAPMGGANAAVVNFKGLSIRVIMDYAFATDKNQIRFDVLYGTKTLFPELAVRLLG
ncbi:MAG TPA: P22 phage major capsid protein family protein, partial [Candidatus Paceibacterota bacterium]|nr:P22 phage major capsid protein family protein [Candidatus Paceibacterota bacterium]